MSPQQKRKSVGRTRATSRARCKQKCTAVSMDWYVCRHVHNLAPRFRVARLFGARKFPFRQGLWIEDLQTPPGQECSNGSMILLAVVLWRAFLCQTESLDPAGPEIRHETSDDQNSTLLTRNQKLR